MTNNQLTEFAERKVKHLTQAIGQSAFTSIRLELENELALAKLALSALQEHRKAAEPVGGDELDQMIWRLERDGGMTPKMLSLMRELREVRKAKGESVMYCSEETIACAKDGELLLRTLSSPSGDCVIPLYIAPPAPVVPDTLPCPVFLEPGLKFGRGVRTQCMLDALNRRAEYHAEIDAMTPEQRAEHDAGISEFKAMLGGYDRNNAWTSINELGRYDGDEIQNEVSCMPQGAERIRRLRHAIGVVPLKDDEMSLLLNAEKLNQPVSETERTYQNSFTDAELEMMTHGNNPQANAYRELLARRNSQATPDGWVLVPEDPTHEMLEAGDAQFGTYDVYRRMIEAAPKEVGYE